MFFDVSKNLAALDEFLLSDAVDETAMLLSELDGFLTGAIVCPETVLPHEWMPLIWGEEPPVFDDEDHGQAVTGLVMERYDDISRELDRGRFRPIYDLDRDETALWEIWIEGFWRAISSRSEAWAALGSAASFRSKIHDRPSAQSATGPKRNGIDEIQ